MLHRVLPYKHAISEILRNSPERLPLLCSMKEWDQLEQLHTFLEVFFNATVQLSCSYIPSVHQLLQHLYLISNVCFFRLIFFSLQILNYFITNLFYFFKVYHYFENIDLRRIAEDVHGDSPLSPIIEAMREKFLKYWDEIPLIIIIVNCLHPSFKKKYTIRLLERYKKNLNLLHIGEEQCVTFALEEMFNLYNTQLHTNQTNQSSSSNHRNIRY
jgi:Domain of unknown function (DUF4413)